MKPTFSVFQQPIKFDCVFWAILTDFIKRLANPQAKCFKKCVKSFLVHSSTKDSLKSSKNVVKYFPHSAFWWTGQWVDTLLVELMKTT